MIGIVVSAILLSTVIDVQGRYVYQPDIHRSVSHKKVIATWEEAKQRCEREGAILASPVDNDLLEYMKSSIGANNHNTPYFIGMKASANPELIFVSVEGVLLENLPAGAQDMIEELDPQDGDCLSMGRHNIQVVTCRSRLPYMCLTSVTTEATTEITTQATTEPTTEVTTQATTEATTEVTTQATTEATTEMTTQATTEATTEVTTEATTPVPTDCGSGYKLYSTGSCYKVHLEEKTWDDAQSICVSEGAYLAVINNEYEAKVIKNFAFSRNKPTWLTIGLRDYKSDGHWSSIHNDPIDQVFHVWALSRSNDRYCGSFKWDGYVDDQYCGAAIPFICERLPQAQ